MLSLLGYSSDGQPCRNEQINLIKRTEVGFSALVFKQSPDIVALGIFIKISYKTRNA